MLNLFEDLKISEDKLHEKFKIIKNHLRLTGEFLVLNEWIKGFKDRDNKIVKEFQTTFHSAFWEFYLYALSKEAGFEVDFSKNSPDFIITKPIKFYIEAVVANIKKDGKQEIERTLDDILSMIQPYWEQKNFDESMIESITRYSNAFMSKSNKYSEYSKSYDWDSNAPYVIALGGYEQINYGNNFYHAMVALLYGMYLNSKENFYIQRQTIVKTGSDAPIPIGLFLTNAYSHVSAIIFSCTITLGKLTSLAISQKKSAVNLNAVMCIRHDHEEPCFKPQIISPENPEYLTDGVFIFHNPFAENPLPKGIFDKTNVVHFEFDTATKILSKNGNNLPIVSRINLAGGHIIMKSIAQRVFDSFNPDLVFSLAIVKNVQNGDEAGIHDVIFQDTEDFNLEFTLTFDHAALLRYKIKKGKEFIVTCKIPEKYRIVDFDESKATICKNFRKFVCFKLDEGKLVSFEERI